MINGYVHIRKVFFNIGVATPGSRMDLSYIYMICCSHAKAYKTKNGFPKCHGPGTQGRAFYNKKSNFFPKCLGRGTQGRVFK
jgi:hypothetical protein